MSNGHSAGAHFLVLGLWVALGPAPVVAQAVLERVPAPVATTGTVYLDQDGDGVRDAGEPGVAGVSVTDQEQIVRTDAQGRFELDARGYGLVSVAPPDGYATSGVWWANAGPADFGLIEVPEARSFRFIHASDTHISAASVERTRRLRAMVDSIRPAFVLITGDLVRDALRVPEEEARGYYELLLRELETFSVPVHVVPGNHEKFGIERASSLIPTDHPLYGNRMYRHYLGPNYYAFSYGGVRFLGLDSVDYEDQWYHGHLDSIQLGWLREEIEGLPSGAPVVTFNHIPFVSAAGARRGYEVGGAAPPLIRIDGVERYRHNVYNHEEVLSLIGDHLEVALAGHIHMFEQIRYQTQDGDQRLHQAGAVVGPAPGEANGYGPLSGITLYSVEGGRVDDGVFLPLDPPRSR